RPTPQVESAVTRLLVAIKQLLEALTDWSTGKLTETQVSDVYVQLGNDFNTCVIAFAAFDIDMRELRGVPEDLRNVLETALAEDATPETLERFLPEVRKIITGLLQGLRTKQTLFRQTVADRAQRRAERQSSSSSSQRSGRSGSRPLPPPRIPEESRTISPPPLTSPPPSQATQAMTKVVASAVPERMSISSRRKLSASGSQTGQRAQSPRATGSDSEGSGNIRFVGGFATQRPPSIPIPTPPAGDGLADLVANASAAEERLRSPRLRRLPLPPGTTVNLSGIISDKDEPPDVQTASGRSSVTLTQDLTVTPPRHSAPLPAISPDVKRYSLSDKPVSPPSRATNSTAPAVNIEQASPSPPSIATERMEGLTTPSPPPPSESTLDPSPAVERSLAALQQSEVLARKASKRFSTYTFSKITGTSAGLAANTMPGGSKPM
ncbi:Bud site selection protein 6, partial [Tulasnella sp. 403]